MIFMVLLAGSASISLGNSLNDLNPDGTPPITFTRLIARVASGNDISSTASLQLPADLDTVLESVLLIHAGKSIGSGVVISQDGYALTAAHLLSGLEEVVVQFRSGPELTADVLK